MIVVDTNVIGSLFLSTDRSGQSEKVLIKDPRWAAPLLWRSELRNVLALYLRKKIISSGDALRIMREAEAIMQGGEYSVESSLVLNLVDLSSCSAYDCEFVALAQDLGVSLVTVDKSIASEFPGIALSIDAFVND